MGTESIGELAAGRPPLAGMLFDLDGVLVDSVAAWGELLRDAVEALGGREFTEEEYRRSFGQSIADDCVAFLPRVTPDDLRRFYLERFAVRAPMARVLDFAAEALAACRARGLRTACVTNSPVAIARALLAAAGLTDGLDALVGEDDVKHPKPAPDPVLLAAERIGVEPRACALVGDSRYDIAAARDAGAIAIAIGVGAGLELDADHRIASLRELPALLDVLMGGHRGLSR